MKKIDNNTKAFLELIKAGLWEKEVRLLPIGRFDFASIQQFAEEQSVVGLVTAGLDHVKDMTVPQEYSLLFTGQTLQLEQRNQAMNYFIGVLVEKMRGEGIDTVLVKGQGVAQCYVRPLWRACGDVDFFLSKDNYLKAKEFLMQLATSVEEEDMLRLHLGMTIDPWVVELHGTMHGNLSKGINVVLDKVYSSVFFQGNVRSWINDGIPVFLPAANDDVIIIFTHFINHFYVGGVGLRQICDWCRLLWKYKNEVDIDLLSQRLEEMGLISEWKAFASLAVDYLGMPTEGMPLYVNSKRQKKQSRKILNLIIEAGNFGHNIDESYRNKHPWLVEKSITFWRRLAQFIRKTTIFPLDSIRFFFTYVARRAKSFI